MPLQEHALLVDLFRASPRLAFDLLRAHGVVLGAAVEPRLLESTFPVAVPDYHVDLAIASVDAGGDPRLVALVEVQLEIDPAKKRSWPLYQAAACARWECEACVLVVAIDRRVAAWAAAPVRLGPGESVFRAVVLGPDDVPRDGGAGGSPELLLLSALAHGHDEPATIGLAVASIAHLNDARAKAYFDLLRYNLGDALDRALEALMTTGEHKYLSDFARKYYGEGEAKGEAQGEARGKAIGEAKGKRASLLIVLAARELRPDAAQLAKIEACEDLALLDRWITAAARAERVDALFAE